MRSTFDYEVAGAADFFSTIGQLSKASFQEDDACLTVRSSAASTISHSSRRTERIIAILQFPDIEDDINFMRAIVNGRFRFETFGIRSHGPQRKTDDARDFHVAVFEKMPRLGDPRAIDANGKELVFPGLGTQIFDVFGGCLRFQKGMVNEGGQLCRRKHELKF